MKNIAGTFHIHYQCRNSNSIKINSMVRMAYTG